ncbi:hypothetical protein VCSRO29_3441 [Vibrio cholerae]|nr:hypothetical protein [Vibrio cholerae]GHZ29696.1 hypothetical protein VCSRO29_3441 [Vibrio cholerae]
MRGHMKNEETEFELILNSTRSHAGYFSWETDQGIEERGVVECFREALEKNGELFFTGYRSRRQGEDPPDCEAIRTDGKKIAIEITEIVDGKAIAAARLHKAFLSKPWTAEQLDQIINTRISKKDKPSKIYGGPYEEHILLLCCDEPAILDYGLVEHIKQQSYGKTSTITRVFLLLSYDPRVQCCPYIELQTSRA